MRSFSSWKTPLFIAGLLVAAAVYLSSLGVRSTATAEPSDQDGVIFRKSLDGKSEVVVIRGKERPPGEIASLMPNVSSPATACVYRSVSEVRLELRAPGKAPLLLSSWLFLEQNTGSGGKDPGRFDVLDVLAIGPHIVLATAENGDIEFYRTTRDGPVQRASHRVGEWWPAGSAYPARPFLPIDRTKVQAVLSRSSDGRIIAEVTDLRLREAHRTRLIESQYAWSFHRDRSSAATADEKAREWNPVVASSDRIAQAAKLAFDAAEAKKKQTVAAAQEAVAALFAATDYSAWQAMPRTWRKTLSPEVQREIIVELLANAESVRELPRPRTAPTSPAIPRPDPAFLKDTREDVFTTAGRAVWAIQELLLLSAHHEHASDESLYASLPPGSALAQRVIRALAMPATMQWETLPAQARVRLASTGDADPRLLRELAKAPEVEVRRAVAGNLCTASTTLEKLKTDQDPEVRNAAAQNGRFPRRCGGLRFGE